MTVHARIKLRKDVTDLDKAEDWYNEVKETLQGKTDCTMRASASNKEPEIEITKDT